MKIFIDNCHGTLWFCLNVARWVGFLVPDELTGIKKKLYPFYVFFWFMFIVGIYVITQTGCLIQVWGNLSDMTNASFLLFTNISFSIKIINLIMKRNCVQGIIDEGDLELRNENRLEGIKIIEKSSMDNRYVIYVYAFVTMVTTCGWVASGQMNRELPLNAWYPYDTTKSPAYEITYVHQSIAVIFLAVVNASLDQLVTSLISVCRARLKLVNLSLRNLCSDMDLTHNLLTKEQEATISQRLGICVKKHQDALNSARLIQDCFTFPILGQLTVAIFIICATAYQLAIEENDSVLRIVSMTTYLMCMIIQVYLYCYQGNYLTDECAEVCDAAYESPWYTYPIPLRRALLIIMVRSQAVVKITACGFAQVSLDCFMAIIKASYSFYTVLQQVEAK